MENLFNPFFADNKVYQEQDPIENLADQQPLIYSSKNTSHADHAKFERFYYSADAHVNSGADLDVAPEYVRGETSGDLHPVIESKGSNESTGDADRASCSKAGKASEAARKYRQKKKRMHETSMSELQRYKSENVFLRKFITNIISNAERSHLQEILRQVVKEPEEPEIDSSEGTDRKSNTKQPRQNR